MSGHFFLDYCDIFGYGFGTSRLLFSLFIEIKSNIFISVYFIIIIIEASYSFFFSSYLSMLSDVASYIILWSFQIVATHTYVPSTWEKIPPSSPINVSISLLLSRSKLTVDLINVFGIQLQYLKEKIPYTRREIRVQKTSSW